MEKSVEQARTALETFSGAAQKAVSSVEAALPSGARKSAAKHFLIPKPT